MSAIKFAIALAFLKLAIGVMKDRSVLHVRNNRKMSSETIHRPAAFVMRGKAGSVLTSRLALSYLVSCAGYGRIAGFSRLGSGPALCRTSSALGEWLHLGG